MGREINLDGGEMTILKTLGFSGNQMMGKFLIERTEDMMPAEFLETLDGLLTRGYVLSTKTNITAIDEVTNSFFRVNPSYSRDLRDAVNPSGRRDREQRGRRQRRH
jgi:hypothetical protein